MEKKQKVAIMWFGEPCIFNIIDINYNTSQVQVQAEGRYGSFWADFKDCMSQYKIDWFWMQKAAEESKRLQIKETMLNWQNMKSNYNL